MKKQNSSDILYKLLAPVAVFLFKLIFLPKIKGKEHIPKENSAVLAGNHITSFDCFMVMAGTRRCIHFLAKAELFKFSFTNWFFRNAGLIPVHRHRRDRDALCSAMEYLKKGELVGVFPEGTVNKTFETPVLPFKIGAVKMAYETKSPIVPFTIKGKYIPFIRSVEIIFQEPYYVTDKDLKSENENLVRKVCSNLSAKE